MKRLVMLLLGMGLGLVSCEQKENKHFNYIDPEVSGLDFSNTLQASPELNILTYLYYYNGGGIAAGDFNNDNLTDLFFTSNQGPDKLYLNLGDLKFKDISLLANIPDSGGWSTGVTHVDINNDGLLDLYICKAAGYRALKGRNLLYVNQGPDDNGTPSFKEEAAKYGLDFSGLSTQAAFFDYDLDGDLDAFLMNHSVHPNRAYGKGTQRQQVDLRSGDRLYRNEDGKFVDVSAETGIFQGKIGYGLGLAIGYINEDNLPDLYIGNDFFENDYLYLSQADGTFEEQISKSTAGIGHTTHFSMGNDLADLNNDQLPDLVAVDMLPDDLETYRTSGLEYAFPIYAAYLKSGYSPQYMQNTLQLNQGNGVFSEVAHLAGIQATDWSWGVLAADLDNDSYRDLYISNGIKGATNDMDFIRFISNEEIQRNIDKGMTEQDMNLIDKMPAIKKPNFFFRNQGGEKFADMSKDWAEVKPSYSNGIAYADLDNDGDLDLVVNNIDEPAYLLENTIDSSGNYLKVKFNGQSKNPFGIGARVRLYSNGTHQYGENFVSRGYISAVPPKVHFGLAENPIVDSLVVIWPSGKRQLLKNVEANQEITLLESSAFEQDTTKISVQQPGYLTQDNKFNFPFIHKEQSPLEFSRDPLIPYASTNAGPDIDAADINNDGLTDLFISGAKMQASELYVQQPNGQFRIHQPDLFAQDARSEDVSQVFFDADGDGWLDILVVSGGNEYKSGAPLAPRLYRNNEGNFTKDPQQFAGINVNASRVVAEDIDRDGDLDVTIASDIIPWEYGKTPIQYIFTNDGKGSFTDATNDWCPDFSSVGNVKDLAWADLNGDGFPDLIAVGHWMPVTIYMNNGSRLEKVKDNGLGETNGWWNTLEVADVDRDGDLDIIAGNFGENSRLRASADHPMKLYRQDFDSNGSVETLVTYFHDGKETPFASKDELVSQLPNLNKKFLSYSSFAKASLEDLFGKKNLQQAKKKYVYTLGSGLFLNDGNGFFEAKPLPFLAQASTVQDIAIADFNSDSFPDLLLVGNNYEISTQLGRMDALHGLILQNDKNGGYLNMSRPGVRIQGAARNIVSFKHNNIAYYGVSINNGPPVFIKVNQD